MSLRDRLWRGPADPAQIVPLQWLRGLAACAVVVEHLIERYARRGILPLDTPDFAGRMGQTGVFAFFAISGFIMVHISLRSESARGWRAGARFLRNRYLRVAPLYYLTTLLMILFAGATRSLGTHGDYRAPGVRELILSFAFVPHRGTEGNLQPVYGLGWTLNYEMFFYLLFAGGLMLGARRGAWAVLALLAVLITMGAGWHAPIEPIGWPVLAYVYTRPVMLYFAIGILVALLRDRLQVRTPAWPAWVMALGAAFALAIAVVGPGGPGGSEMDRAQPATLAAITLGLMLCTIPTVRPGGAPWLERLSRALGDSSYSIYLTHSFLLGALAALSAPLIVKGGIVALVAMALLASLICFVAGWLVWRLVERPISDALRHRRLNPAEAVAP